MTLHATAKVEDADVRRVVAHRQPVRAHDDRRAVGVGVGVERRGRGLHGVEDEGEVRARATVLHHRVIRGAVQ